MTVRSSRAATALTVASVLLTVCVAGIAPAAATPTPAGASPTWAYGNLSYVAFHGAAGKYVYHGNATYGFSTVFDEIANSTSGVVAVHVARTLGARLAVEYCLPDCLMPRAVANYSLHAYETTNAWANLTTRGTVTENGDAVPALALENSYATVDAKLRESGTTLSAGVLLRQRSFELNVTGEFGVGLSPALGLVPIGATNLTPGAAWNSSSTYSASGSAAWAWAYAESGSLVGVPVHAGDSGTIAASRTGPVGLNGSYSPGSVFGYGGQNFPAIELNLSGPFALDEGAYLVPAAAEVFGAGVHPWSTDQDGRAVVTIAEIDMHPGRFYQGRYPVVASGFTIASATDNVAAALTAGSGATPAAGGNSTFVQGRPESPQRAQQTQSCLISGTDCSGPLVPRIPVRFVVVAGVGGVAVAAVVLVVAARRRPPAPVYPNSTLYPPGRPARTAPAPPPPEKPPEDDPLGHLW